MKSMGRLERVVIIISILVIVAGVSYGAVKTILQLTEETEPTSGDLLHLWELDAAASRKVTIANLTRGIQVDSNELVNTSGSIGLADHNTARTALGLAIGSDVQAYSVDLDSFSGPTAWRMFYSDAATPFIQEIALGANNTFLESNSTSSAPAFRALLYSDLTAFTEANLYTLLSDVDMFMEALVDETTGHQLGSSLDFNNKVLFDDWTAFGAADATPNVSAGSFFKTANAGATTITDFDDTDDHGDFEDGRLLFLWIDDANTTLDLTASEITWASQGANDYACEEDDYFIFAFNSGADQWYVLSGPMPSVVAISALTLPQGTDPDATASGRIGLDTDGANETGDESVRMGDGVNQFLLGRKLKCFQATVIKPNDLANATRDACPIWSNETGMTFTVTKIEAWSGTDDTEVNVEEEDADGANNATVDALNIQTNGTGLFYHTETTITGATIEANHIILLDFDDTDDPEWVKVSICGWFNADVN